MKDEIAGASRPLASGVQGYRERVAFRAGGFVAVPVRVRFAAVLRAAVAFLAVVFRAVALFPVVFFAVALFPVAFFAGTRFDGATRLAGVVAFPAVRAVRPGRFAGVFAAVAPVARRVAVATFFARAVLLPGAFFAPVALRAAAGLVGVRVLPPRPCAGRRGSVTVDRIGPARRESAISAPPRPALLLGTAPGFHPGTPGTATSGHRARHRLAADRRLHR